MRHLFLIVMMLLSLPEASGCVPVYVHTYETYPVLPDSAGGTSTVDNPQITVVYDACQLFRSVRNERTLTLPDDSTYSCWSFNYKAQIEFNPAVCDNKCIYGIAGSEPPKPGEPCADNTQPSTDINNNPCWLPQDSRLPNCAPDITSRYLSLCVAASDGTIPAVPGICAYHSNFASNPRFLSACYPAPVHPLPPAFCLWNSDQEITPTPQNVPPTPPPINVTVKFCDDVNSAEVAKSLCIDATNLGKSTPTSSSNKIHCEVDLPTSIPVTGQSITINNCNWTQDDGSLFTLGQFKCIANGNTDGTPIYEDNYKLCLYDVPYNSSPNDVVNIPKTCQAGDDGSVSQNCVPDCSPDNSNPACAPCDKRLCVDIYPFEFQCQNIDDSDQRLKVYCKSDLEAYCLKRTQDNNEYLKFNQCVGNRNLCAKTENSDASVNFGGAVGWPCKTVNKVLTGFTTPDQRYTIQPN